MRSSLGGTVVDDFDSPELGPDVMVASGTAGLVIGAGG